MFLIKYYVFYGFPPPVFTSGRLCAGMTFVIITCGNLVIPAEAGIQFKTIYQIKNSQYFIKTCLANSVTYVYELYIIFSYFT